MINLSRAKIAACDAEGTAENSRHVREVGAAEHPEITVTLTTISERLKHLPDVVASLEQQILKPERIILNISREPYLLDKGIDPNNSILRTLQKSSRFQLNWVENTGPYRKCMSLLMNSLAHKYFEEEIFVTVDDDTLYPPDFLEGLYARFVEHDCVVAYRGRLMGLAPSGNFLPYVNWGPGVESPSLLNLATGKDGVMYSTRFFTKQVADLKAAISLAPTADDLWWKWHSAMNGVPTFIINPEACTSDYKSFPVVDYSKEYRGHSLYALHNSVHAGGANDKAVEELENWFGSMYGMTLAELVRS
jgi:hypothetical protein